MIFQDPTNSLNPRQRIGQTLEIPLRLNTELSAIEREKRIYQTLRQVGLLPEHANYYPHNLNFVSHKCRQYHVFLAVLASSL